MRANASLRLQLPKPSSLHAQALGADVARPQRRSLDSFPQYPLTRVRLSPAEANALYHSSGWAVAEHADALRGALGRAAAHRDSE